jgi:predicted metal-dependent HD superfamily phosphohydrolase
MEAVAEPTMADPLTRSLTRRWATACREGCLTGHGDVPAIGLELIARYREPQRHYHTVEHLAAVLDVLDELAHPAPAPLAVRLAAWFHDAVYDPRASDNEERSAALARAVLHRLGAAPAVGERVAELVMATRTHAAPGDAEAALLLDADLSVLGAPPPVYAAYAAAIRLEYAHLDDEVFRPGRAAVLEGMVERQALFQTAAGRQRFERAARVNITGELAALRARR